MINKIALGTAQFGLDYGISNAKGKVPRNEVESILDVCFENGITTLDTASAYGDAERVLGSCIQSRNFNIITKSNPTDEKGSEIEKQFHDSLEHLGRESVEGLLIHDFELYRRNPEIIETLHLLKRKGKVSKIGFSVYFPEQVEFLFSAGVSFDLVQLPYNILDNRFDSVLGKLKKKKIEVHSRSTFLQGLFFLPKERKAKLFPEVLDQLDRLDNLSKENDIPLHSLLLNYSLMNENIDRVVIGVESLANARENIRAVSFFDRVTALKNQLKSLSIDDENILLPFHWKLTQK